MEEVGQTYHPLPRTDTPATGHPERTWSVPLVFLEPPQRFKIRRERDLPLILDITADGRRFLVAQPLESDRDVPITVIVNWPKTAGTVTD